MCSAGVLFRSLCTVQYRKIRKWPKGLKSKPSHEILVEGSLFGILTDFIHLQYFSDKILVLVVFSTWLWLNVKNMKISIYEYMNMVKTMMTLRKLEHEHLKVCVKFGVNSYGQFYQNQGRVISDWKFSAINYFNFKLLSSFYYK